MGWLDDDGLSKRGGGGICRAFRVSTRGLSPGTGTGSGSGSGLVSGRKRLQALGLA